LKKSNQPKLKLAYLTFERQVRKKEKQKLLKKLGKSIKKIVKGKKK
jgi:hypothetical protein